MLVDPGLPTLSATADRIARRELSPVEVTEEVQHQQGRGGQRRRQPGHERLAKLPATGGRLRPPPDRRRRPPARGQDCSNEADLTIEQVLLGERCDAR